MKNRIILACGAALIAMVFIVAMPARFLPSWAPAWLRDARINLGLDLQGGIHLEYALDTSVITDGNGNGTTEDEIAHALDAVQAVVERRVNAFGVGEPIVQRVKIGDEQRLIVELPGIRDVEAAKNVIKETPFLDFREDVSDDPEVQEQIAAREAAARTAAQRALAAVQRGDDLAAAAQEAGGIVGTQEAVRAGTFGEDFDAKVFVDGAAEGLVPAVIDVPVGWMIVRRDAVRTVTQPKVDILTGKAVDGETEDVLVADITYILIPRPQPDPALVWKKTSLTGAQLASADYDPGSAANGGIAEPAVLLNFNDEGKRLFAEITKGHIGERFAIFVDDELVSAPVIQAEITNGQAQITGNFTPEEAKRLAQRLNEGALPVPITLVAQQSVDATLGAQALAAGLRAGIIGVVLTMLYMIFYYRFFGLVAAAALVIYAAIIIALFKLSSLLPGGLAITLTLSGIAGFILSVGMAVDANILIFERIKEERRRGKTLRSAVAIGFTRAWTSIRDGNISTILICVILIGLGSGFVKGFALILLIGVLVSMFTAVVLTRTFLRIVATERLERIKWFIGA